MRTLNNLKNLPCIISGNEFENVKLMDSSGVYHDSIRTRAAIEMAQESNLDLVCFNTATERDLPFCKILNFGKWKYNQDKKKKQNKDSKKTKEIRISVDISDNDLGHKIKQAKEFLARGDDVVASMLLRGRQRYRMKDAIEKMDSIRDMCSEFGGESARKNIAPNVTLRLTPLSNKKTISNK